MPTLTLSPVLFVLCRLAGLAGLVLVFPLLMTLWDHGSTREILSFALPLAGSLGVFQVSRILERRGKTQLKSPAQGFQCVTFGWTIFALLGAVPYWISGALPTFVDAWFESMSGFTTTGASVFTSVEAVPRGLLLWRAMSQFIGGLGIIALFVAILPALGGGGVVLMRSEVTASVVEERLRPRIRDTARVLWMIYAGLFVANVVCLLLCDLSMFDAICHALTTVSTGGFSTKDISFAEFSPTAQWVCILFMFLGATSFLLHGKAVTGDVKAYAKSEEFRAYVLVLAFATALVTIVVMRNAEPVVGTTTRTLSPSLHDEIHFATALRDAAFQVTSIMTSTGYASTDYNGWPDATRFLLVGLMFVGSCSGSTAGGVKLFRVLIVLRTIVRQLRLILSPARVINVRYGNSVIPRDALLAAATLVLVSLLIVVVSALALSLMGLAMEEAVSGAVSCLGCVGPAFGELGPTGNFAGVPAAGKVLFSILMLMGRLEIYAVLVLGAMIGRR